MGGSSSKSKVDNSQSYRTSSNFSFDYTNQQSITTDQSHAQVHNNSQNFVFVAGDVCKPMEVGTARIVGNNGSLSAASRQGGSPDQSAAFSNKHDGVVRSNATSSHAFDFAAKLA